MSKEKPTDKKVSPTPASEDVEKLSPIRKSLFQAGFMAGMGYRGCPKYDPKDPEVFAKAMVACDQMFEVMDTDLEEDGGGASDFQSLARILGLSEDDEPKK